MTTATTTLEAEIDLNMVADGDDVEWTTCEECDASVHAEYADEHDDLCPKCHRKAEATEELEEAEADLEGMAEEMKELQERIAEAKRTIKAARARLARIG